MSLTKNPHTAHLEKPGESLFVITDPEVTGKTGITKISYISPVSGVMSTTGIDDTDKSGIDIEALRKKAQEMQEKARIAKAKRNPEWMIMYDDMKEMRKRIKEEEDRMREMRQRRGTHQAHLERGRRERKLTHWELTQQLVSQVGHRWTQSRVRQARNRAP
jgi:hypothetical protein